MFDTVAEILTAISDRDSDLDTLKSRMESDMGLYTLAAYQAEKGYESYTSSAPRNFFDKVMDGLNSAELTLQIKLPEDASEKERRAASVGELYLFGGLCEVDRTFRQRGEPSFREQLAFHCNLRGWVAVRGLVYPQKDKTVFDVLVWDIIHTTWESGFNGLLWAANKRKLTRSQVYSEYGIEVKGKDAELVDWWDEERNAIIIEGEFAKSPQAHNLGHVPVFIGAVGSMPTLQTRTFDSTIQYRGDPVWSAARGLYEPFNKITSRTMDIYERSVAGSLVHKSRMGDKAIDGDPYRTYQEIKIAEDESIMPLETPKAPPETAILHAIISTDIQQSTLPYPLAYGGTRQAMSGAALGILQESTRSVYNPRTGLIEQAYTWLCEEFLRQYVERGAQVVQLKGFKPDGKFFAVKVKPKEIDPEWYIMVRCQPRLPRDRQGEIMMALAATSKRAPDDIALISKQTAREDILQLRDPDAEEDKVLEEIGQALPPIMAAKIAAALKARGKEELARDVMMLLNPQAGQRAQGPPPELLMAAVEALAGSGDPQLQQMAMALAQYVKGGPQGKVAGPVTEGAPVGPQGAVMPGEGPMPGPEIIEQPMGPI